MKTENIVTELLSKTEFVELFNPDNPLVLENGKVLWQVEAAYQTYGELNTDGSNAILICHALSGNAHAAGIITEEEVSRCGNHKFLTKYNQMYLNKPGWWDSLIGPGKVFDTDKFFVICSNILGSCYGTTGPASKNIISEDFYRASFPSVTVRDIVKVQKELIERLGVKSLKTISGGSLGGMQALEWALMYPKLVRSIIPIAASAAHSAWAMGLNRMAKQAIKNDPAWNKGNYETQPYKGIAHAREIAMLSYRTYQSFETKFGRQRQEEKEDSPFAVESYLKYQGDKFYNRFDANSYLCIADTLDSNDVSAGRSSVETALNSIQIPVKCVGIDSDILYPASEQRQIAENIPGAEYAEIKSEHGHDAFLIEFEQLEEIIAGFLESIS